MHLLLLYQLSSTYIFILFLVYFSVMHCNTLREARVIKAIQKWLLRNGLDSTSSLSLASRKHSFQDILTAVLILGCTVELQCLPVIISTYERKATLFRAPSPVCPQTVRDTCIVQYSTDGMISPQFM